MKYLNKILNKMENSPYISKIKLNASCQVCAAIICNHIELSGLNAVSWFKHQTKLSIVSLIWKQGGLGVQEAAKDRLILEKEPLKPMI